MPANRGILGHVEWNDGTPAKNVKITITEKDPIFNDQLPATITDKDGNFIITYHPNQYSMKPPFQEKPDIEIKLEYLKNDIPKKVKIIYKDVKNEWLIIDILKLDDLPDECESIIEEEVIYREMNIFIINLKENIDINDPNNNDIWEIYIGSILEYSENSIIPKRTTLKINSWGGKVIVTDAIKEGSISNEEKKLNEKSIELLEKRNAYFEECSLLFNWLDKDGNIIHDSIYNTSNTNYMKINDISIFIPKPTSRTVDLEFIPLDRLEINCRVLIKGVSKEFKIISMDSIQNLIL